MPTLQIALTVPEGTTVEITGLEGVGAAAPSVTPDEAVLRYWRALSNNGRKLYGAAARIEQVKGVGYTLEDIGSNLSITHSSALAVYRNVCRTASAWVRDSGETEAPIHLVEIDYPETATGVGRRTRYQLPPGVADLIADLPLVYGEGGEE
jgi:hypothetical protein